MIHFKFQDRDEAIDLNQFKDVDLYKITHEHDLEYLLSFLKGVGFGRVDEEQLKAIADERVVTAFEIAQMLIEESVMITKKDYDNQNVKV